MAVRRGRLVPLTPTPLPLGGRGVGVRGFVWLVVAGLLGVGGAGCGKSSEEPPARTEATRDTPKQEEQPKPAAETISKKPVVRDRLHRSFFEATRKLPPPDQRPPDRTLTGKPIGKLYG